MQANQTAKPRSRYPELRMVHDYLRATENEIAIDERLLLNFGVTAEAVGHIPRPPKWLKYLGSRPAASRVVARVLRLIWTHGGANCFHFIKKRKLKGLVKRGETRPAGSENSFLLVFSARAAEIARPPHISESPATWLTLPWVEASSAPLGTARTGLLNLLDEKDLDTALRCAQIATKVLNTGKNSAWALQSYTAVPWFCVRLAMEKLEGRFLTAEHFDRWAVLADSAVASARRNGRRADLSLMQHGAVNGDQSGQGGHVFPYKLKYRLRSVGHLHVYDQASANVFKEHILSPTLARQGVKISYFRPSVPLTRIGTGTGLRVLFVGHPICERLHAASVHLLKGRSDLILYYKPHPLAPMSVDMEDYPWQVMSDPSIFPEVDMLVAYPSTLVEEYKSHNIPSVVHAIDMPASDAPALLERILSELQSIAHGTQ